MLVNEKSLSINTIMESKVSYWGSRSNFSENCFLVFACLSDLFPNSSSESFFFRMRPFYAGILSSVAGMVLVKK